MNQKMIATDSWRTHLLITGGVFFTVLLALLLAQLDSLQRQILPSPVAQAIANLNATPTNTPLPAIPLATGTPTPLASSTPLGNDGTATAVSALPNCGFVPSGWALTSVESGETLLALSVRYNLSPEKIRLANCLEPGDLINVSTLYLPSLSATSVPTIVCGPPQDWVLYTVRPGDNIFRLSLRYGTTITALLNANCLTTTRIQAGQRLYVPPIVVLPPTAMATTTPTKTATPTATGTSTHTPTSTVPPLPTVTGTPTSTATGTVTATPTITVTVSSTPTASATATGMPTATTLPSDTPTSTATPSPTPSGTALPTGTLTPTASAIPTVLATPSSTPTATATPTATDTAVPTTTATNTPTP